MEESSPADYFEVISGTDSKALLKPKSVALVLSNSENKGPNIMTAGWWMTAGYNPFRYLVGVSHKTYTYEIIEENKQFVLAVPSAEMIDAVTLSGKVSGEELDKLDHLGLETIPGEEIDVPLLKNAIGNIECTVMDSFDFKNCTYYFGGVEKAYASPEGLDGRLLSLDEDVLAYMGSDWETEDSLTKHRYYAEVEGDDLEAYPGDEVIEGLPAELKEQFEG